MPPLKTLVAMLGFALAASATPGPVNIVGSMCGARFGPVRALPFVTGATFCFAAILLVSGACLRAGAAKLSVMAMPMTLAGSGYLLWMSWRLARAGDPIAGEATGKLPGFWSGMVIQGMNPKAWIAALSALTTFVLPLPEPGPALLVFAALFTCVCWLSPALWAYAGARIGKRSFTDFNRMMAALLAISVVWMLWSVTLV